MAWMLALVFALAWSATEAWAHGGQYRGPGGAVPPKLREPHDPVPPTPPDPTGGPVTEPSDGRPTPPMGPVTPDPVAPPTGGDPLTGGSGRPTGTSSRITAESWMFWYEYNKEALQQVKQGIYRIQGSNHPLGGLSHLGAGARTGQRHDVRAAVASKIIPALLWTMDAGHAHHQDTESAAYIALAKVTSTPEHIERIEKGLKSKNLVTREAAALALGLLRREKPADQFDAASLDDVRRVLFETFADEKLQARMRGFAALSIGLLGDQPTGRGTDDGAAATTARIFDLLRKRYNHQDLPVALLMAAGMQRRDTITPAQYDVLRTCVLKQRLYKNDVQPYVASYAAQALGRVGDKDVDIHVLRRVLASRRTSPNVMRSVVIALGKLGRRCSSTTRAQIASELQTAVSRKRIRDRTARNFAVISVAYLIAADVEAGRTEVLGGAKSGDWLMKVTEGGPFGTRSFGALALGLACKAIGDETTITLYGGFLTQAREVLRSGLRAKKKAKRARAAFAVALGLAHDTRSIGDLTDLVADDREDDELRGYAAIALGHIGNDSKRVLVPIRKALVKRRSEQLRRTTATALGMLTDRKAVGILLDELKRARSQSAKGQVVVALAKVGDERAVDPLIAMLRNVDEQDLTRALACAGLGIVGDLVWLPSLSLLGEDLNYRASGDMINEVLSIL